MRKLLLATAFGLCVTAVAQAQSNLPFKVEAVASFDEPWALAILPDGRMLVTEMKGNRFILPQQGKEAAKVAGVPDVDYGGQGGLGDVVLHPKFAENRLVYLSYAEGGPGGTRGAAVLRAVLDETEDGAQVSDVEVIWRQYPKVYGYGHYGHRLLFDDDGYLWITSGDRQPRTCRPTSARSCACTTTARFQRTIRSSSIRAVMQRSTTPASTLCVLEDGRRGGTGRLLKLTPKE